MKIVFLSDNRTSDDALATEHGLSIYVETGKHRVLLDTGASDVFIRNAQALNIDLRMVDYVFISHGHSDHIGGLPYFIKINSTAKIIMSPNVIGGKYVSKRGREHSITTEIDFNSFSDRIITADCNKDIDDEISIIADIPYAEHMPDGNKALFRTNDDGDLIPDDFCHETAIRVADVLFTGCAHHGILNILSAAGKVPAYVIGGFHLLDDYESDDSIKRIADILHRKYHNSLFFTGHCTGNRCIEQLKTLMKGKLDMFCLGYHIPEITIEEMHEADDDTCKSIRKLVRQLSVSCKLPSDDYIKEILSSASSALFVIKSDGVIAGMAVLCRCVMPTGTKYWIEDVTIDSSYRYKNLGKRLVRHILEQIPSDSNVMLTSRPSRTAANRMYRGLGFRQRETNVYKKNI